MSRAHLRIGAALAVILLSLSGAVRLGRGAESALPGWVPRGAIDSTILSRYKWRNLGPPIGGRSIAISGVRGRPMEGYFGATGGGLWKTTDGGANWTPITDGLIRSASVGAVAVSESHPDIVWLGMGETCIRGDIQGGDGVYKSTDAGKTWTHIGFESSDAIAKIRIDPKNPDIVFVASFGKFGTDSPDRGVFKTIDGGRTWRKVLYKDAKTGAVDIAVDQTNPNVMFAAMWEAYRNEWSMSSGGPGSSLWKSTDGGEHWTDITRAPGLPAGVDGKIGVALTAADPNRVYALIENENGGLFRSEDGGATWATINTNRNIRQRAFYYTHISADPKNKDIVYTLNVGTFRSTDGGRTSTSFVGGDSHELWIDPDNSDHVLHASDNGAGVTMNASAAGRTWTERDHVTGQIYHIVATSHNPYYICGALQDHSSTCILSTTNLGAAGGGRAGGAGAGGPAGGRGGAGGLATTFDVGGSENGYMAPDPLDIDVFYVGTNANGGGFLNKTNRRTGERRQVSPYPQMFSGEESGVIKERWQWTYPILFSPVDPRVLYVSSQHLWKTTDGAQSWTMISPDLTRHDPKTLGPSGGPITRDMNGPEVYALIFAVGPSKKDVNVIWTGSDDGLVHVTRTGGGLAPTSWKNVTPKEMPDFGRVSQIDASAWDAATAYVAVKRPLLDDRAPYIFRTHDFGLTWKKIVNGIRPDEFVHVVREDPYRKGLLYAATQHGIYISYNDGDDWQSLSLNLPDLPVWDLIVQPNDLAIATHGRGFYILDAINLLRYADVAGAAKDAHLFTPVPAVRSASSATIQYWLKRPAQSLRIDIADTTGKVIRSFIAGAVATADSTGGGRGGGGGGGGGGGRGGGGAGGGGGAPSTAAGFNSVSWDLRYPNAIGFPGMVLWGGGLTGPVAAPGVYRVTMTVDGVTQRANLLVKRNPLYPASDADLRAQVSLAIQVRDKVTEANQAVIDIRRIKTAVTDRLAKSQDPALKTKGEALTRSLSAVEGDIYQVKNQVSQDPLNYPIKVNNRLASLLNGVLNSGDGRPYAQVYTIFRDLSAELKVHTDRLTRALAVDLAAFNTEAKRAGVEPIAAK